MTVPSGNPVHCDRAFVLGAGFSVAHGFPLARDLKKHVIGLVNDAHESRSELMPDEHRWHQFSTGLDIVDPSGKSEFETILSRLVHEARSVSEEHPIHTTLQVLREATDCLLWRIQESTEEVDECYLNFAKWAAGDRNSEMTAAIVSFNWDLLIEQALTNASVAWRYSATSSSGVPIIKPHGSINWSAHEKAGLLAADLGWTPIGVESRLCYRPNDPLLDPDRRLINADLRYMLFPGDDDEPGEPDLDLLWKDVSRVLAEVERVTLVGYSLPVYDTYAERLLSAHMTGKRIEVINPNDKHIERLISVFGNEISIKQCKFEDSEYATTVPG